MIVIIGGTGLLGKELSKNENTIPLNSEFDLFDFKKLKELLDIKKPEIIINCAAIKSEKVDENPIDAINLNIIGSANISKYCIENNIRLVYISTDYVYPGDTGNFKEDDNINPKNNYAWTKIGGESSTKLVKDHLIIRTSFGSSKFAYDYAFTNLYTSKDYVDIIAPMIFKASTSSVKGTINIGTEKKSIFDYAKRRNNISPSKMIKDMDFTLNLQRYMKNLTTNDFFNLGNIPLVNNLNDSFDDSINCDRYKLSVLLDEETGLVRLKDVVDTRLMFDKYLYISGTSKPFIDHCKSMYTYLNNYIDINDNDVIVDIGGNDATLLKNFKSEIKNKVRYINIEPSDIVNIINDDQIEVINEYFNIDAIKKIGSDVKLIISTNVFQHLYDIESFVMSIKSSLSKNGIWCLEFPYWYESMNTLQFDQIYHEHIYYYNVIPLKKILNKFGLDILTIEHQDIHGGTLRVLITHENTNYYKVDDSVNKYIEIEKKIDNDFYSNWGKGVNYHVKNCYDKIIDISKDSKIAVFGAAAKGCVFLNYLGLDYKNLSYIIDDTIVKQGKYMPGTGLKIHPREIIKEEEPDYILILAHNFKNFIIESLREYGYTNKFIVCLPSLEIID
jgi:hypothetical protein